MPAHALNRTYNKSSYYLYNVEKKRFKIPYINPTNNEID